MPSRSIRPQLRVFSGTVTAITEAAPKLAPGPIETGLRALFRIAPAPFRVVQPPADFDFHEGIMRRQHTAKSDETLFCFELGSPETIAMSGLPLELAINQTIAISAVPGRKIAHHLLVHRHGPEGIAIFIAPGPQQQPFGFDHWLNNRAAWAAW